MMKTKFKRWSVSTQRNTSGVEQVTPTTFFWLGNQTLTSYNLSALRRLLGGNKKALLGCFNWAISENAIKDAAQGKVVLDKLDKYFSDVWMSQPDWNDIYKGHASVSEFMETCLQELADNLEERLPIEGDYVDYKVERRK